MLQHAYKTFLKRRCSVLSHTKSPYIKLKQRGTVFRICIKEFLRVFNQIKFFLTPGNMIRDESASGSFPSRIHGLKKHRIRSATQTKIREDMTEGEKILTVCIL
jgi:hypothetical protein